MEAAAQVVTARVTTVAPLLRRGLVRAARTAGFTVVPAHAAAQVTLRMDSHHPDAGQADGESDVDIVVEMDSIVVTVRRSPDMSTLVRLHGLLAALLDSRAPSDR